jgi:hypothetical protein
LRVKRRKPERKVLLQSKEEEEKNGITTGRERGMDGRGYHRRRGRKEGEGENRRGVGERKGVKDALNDDQQSVDSRCFRTQLRHPSGRAPSRDS